jgi:hypothetical protein
VIELVGDDDSTIDELDEGKIVVEGVNEVNRDDVWIVCNLEVVVECKILVVFGCSDVD